MDSKGLRRSEIFRNHRNLPCKKRLVECCGPRVEETRKPWNTRFLLLTRRTVAEYPKAVVEDTSARLRAELLFLSGPAEHSKIHLMGWIWLDGVLVTV